MHGQTGYPPAHGRGEDVTVRSPDVAESTSVPVAQAVGPTLACAIRELLPPDARIVVAWRDSAQGDWYSADDGAPASLVARALTTLGLHGRTRDPDILDHWTSDTGTPNRLGSVNGAAQVCG